MIYFAHKTYLRSHMKAVKAERENLNEREMNVRANGKEVSLPGGEVG